MDWRFLFAVVALTPFSLIVGVFLAKTAWEPTPKKTDEPKTALAPLAKQQPKVLPEGKKLDNGYVLNLVTMAKEEARPVEERRVLLLKALVCGEELMDQFRNELAKENPDNVDYFFAPGGQAMPVTAQTQIDLMKRAMQQAQDAFQELQLKGVPWNSVDMDSPWSLVDLARDEKYTKNQRLVLLAKADRLLAGYLTEQKKAREMKFGSTNSIIPQPMLLRPVTLDEEKAADIWWSWREEIQKLKKTIEAKP